MDPSSEALQALPPNSRRAGLDDLVANGSLTMSEVRRLLSSLNKHVILAAKAKWEGLPSPWCPEITTCIAKYMDPESTMVARCVSRRWYQEFFNPDFCISIIKLHFRGKFELDYKILTDHEKKAQKDRFQEWLLAATRHRSRRHRGLAQYSTRPYPVLIPNQPRSSGSVFRRQLQDHRQYSNGRVAFKSGDSTDAYITVCCLDASRMDASPELRFMDPDRQGLGKWLLSDELLVAKRLLSLTLLAWPLSNDDTPKLHSVRLYSHIRHISAHRLKVGFITDQNEVFVWRVGGNLIQIDVSDTMRSLIEPKTPVNPPSVLEACPIGVIFHPNGENHFFVFHLQLISEIIDHTSPDQIHVQVQEHGAGGQQNTFSKCLLDYNHDTSDAPFHDRSKLRVEFHLKISSCSRVCPIDTDGLCIIAWDTRSFSIKSPLTTFNIFTKKFGLPTHDLSVLSRYMIAPPLEECLSFTEVGQVLMWREDLLFPIWPAESDDPTWEADMNLIKLKSQDVLLLSVDEHSTTQQWYGAGEFQQHGYDHEPLETTLDGDDDYVTVFGSGGYSVYNFQKAASEIPFPRHQRLEELDTNSE